MPTPSPKRPILAVLAALSIATALVGGCSSSKQSAAPLPDAATLLSKSNLTTRNVKSVHLVLSVTGTIHGLPVKTLTGDLTTSPDTAAKGEANLTVLGSSVDAEFVVYDGTLYAALTPGHWESFGPAAEHAAIANGVASSSQNGLGPHEGLTVVVAVPQGVVAAPGPILRERWSLQQAFALTPVSGGVPADSLRSWSIPGPWCWSAGTQNCRNLRGP